MPIQFRVYSNTTNKIVLTIHKRALFSCTKMSFDAFSGAKRFLNSEHMAPAELNSLSEAVELGGADRYLRTSLFIAPSFSMFSLHQVLEST